MYFDEFLVFRKITYFLLQYFQILADQVDRIEVLKALKTTGKNETVSVTMPVQFMVIAV